MHDETEWVPLTAFAEINPRTILPRSTDVTFIGMADVSEGGEITGSEIRSSRESAGYMAFREGDILFAKITPCMENGKGAMARGLHRGVGFGSTEFHVVRAREHSDSRYLAHWCQSSRLRQAAEAVMTGSAGQRRVPAKFFDQFMVPSMGKAEQQRIAEILDSVEESIRVTERLLDKLEQTRSAIIAGLLSGYPKTDESTRQASPVRSDRSENPQGAHASSWPSLPLRSVCEISSGSTPSRSVRSFWEGGSVPWVTTGEISFSVIDDTKEKVTRDAVASAHLYVYPERTVLVAMYGQGSTRGRVGMLGVPATVNQACAALWCDSRLMRQEFLFNQLVASYDELRRLGHGSHQVNMNAEILGEFAVVVPPLDEQDQILDLIVKFDEHIGAESLALGKLYQLRIGLMDDLLTGQVRVGVGEDAEV